MKPKRMPLDWHLQAGIVLKEMYIVSQKLLVDIGANYPLNSPAHTQAKRLHNPVAKLKCVLDDNVVIEHPSEDTDMLKRVYCQK